MTRVLVTGASGVLGHHLLAAFQAAGLEAWPLVREPGRLKLPWAGPLWVGKLPELGEGPLPEGLTHVVHAAAGWGGRGAWQVNHQATLALARQAERLGLPMMWVGSASVRHPGGGWDPAALRSGQAYVESKAAAAAALECRPGLWQLHPSIILGAWPGGPTSHASLGLARWGPWVRRLPPCRLSGSLGWIHAADLAAMIVAWVQEPSRLPPVAVAAQAPVALNELLGALRPEAPGDRPWSLEAVATWAPWVLRPWMSDWDRHALALRHHGHLEACAPEALGLRSQHPKLASLGAAGLLGV